MRTRVKDPIENRICCYGITNQFYAQSCVIAQESSRFFELDKLRQNCFYSSIDSRCLKEQPLIHGPCMTAFIEDNNYSDLRTYFRHRFLCNICLDKDVFYIRDYFNNEKVRKNSKGNDCMFRSDTLLCCKSRSRTVQCGQLLVYPLQTCYNMVHYDCFLGFLSLLSHECQIIFDWRPHCPSCIIRLLLKKKRISENVYETPEGYRWSTYDALFLHDYKKPSEINPFDTNLSRDPIPRGVLEHHHLRIIPAPIVKKEKAHNLGEKCKVIPESVLAQEELLKKLRGKDNKAMVKDGRGNKIKRFFYYADALKESDSGNSVIDRKLLGRISRHDDKQKGRETKFFDCTVLNKIIGTSTHLEMELPLMTSTS